MTLDPLNREDWERILFALSHFTHNAPFRQTHGKVQVILSPPNAG